jgi:DNA repair exonuclease SbcCD ATPase subunit
MRTRTNKTKDENERLHSEISQLNHKVSNLEQISKPLVGLENQIKDLRAQNQELQGWRKRAEAISIELEETKRKSATSPQDRNDREADTNGEKMYRDLISGKLTTSSLQKKADWLIWFRPETTPL